jgi:hypothetical protein
MGANLVGLVLGVDGAQYFVHELTGGWDGMSLLETFVTPYFIDRGNPRNSIRTNDGVVKMGTLWWSGSGLGHAVIGKVSPSLQGIPLLTSFLMISNTDRSPNPKTRTKQ